MKLNTYVLNEKYELIVNKAFQEASENEGEISEDTSKQLNKISKVLVDHLAKEIKNFNDFDDALSKEKKRIDSEKQKCKKRIDFDKQLLTKILNGDKVKTPQYAISYRKSEQVVINNENNISDEYKIAKWVIDKTSIKNDLKLGKEVSGAELVKNNNIQVK